jgi:hypothetical protein
VPGEVIETARTSDDGLFRCEPSIGLDPIGYQLTCFDIGGLHIDRSDTKLLIAQQPLVMSGHIVLNQVRIAVDLANEIGLVASCQRAGSQQEGQPKAADRIRYENDRESFTKPVK